MNPVLSADLKKAGYEPIDMQESRRLVICASGKEKTGKSTFALSAPGPIAVVSADTGTREACQRVIKATGKEIILHLYKVPKLSAVSQEKRQDEYVPEWERVKKAIEVAVGNIRIKTLVVDTGTEIWELCRLARFGKIAQIKPQHYGPVNAEMRELVKTAYDRYDLNVIFTQKVKKEYRESKKTGDANWTGEFEMAGFGDMPYITDFSIWHYFRRGTDEEQENGVRGHFGIRIVDCPRQNGHMVGEELEDDLCLFPFLASLIYPETGPEDWE